MRLLRVGIDRTNVLVFIVLLNVFCGERSRGNFGGGEEKCIRYGRYRISNPFLVAITRIEQLGPLRAAYRERLRAERAARRLLQTLDVLFERPILNIRQLEAALGVPYRTAERYVEKLTEIGILREVTGQRRNRLYRAEEIIRALE